VSAQDKASGKVQKITITNDQGRLSEVEIERMVADAEKFAAEDADFRSRVEARNKLEGYLYGLRSAMEDGLKEKIDAADSEALKGAIGKALEWLDANKDALVGEYEEKQKSVEKLATPILTKAYSGAPTPSPDDDATEVVVEEAEQ
jgi:molecular chaperone DnaK (HSP70)